MISRAGTVFFLGLFAAYSTPVEVPYVPENLRRNQTVSREAGACRVSGLVEFSYPDSGSICQQGRCRSVREKCQLQVCKAFRAAMAQKLSNGEEVNAYETVFNENPVWCSYVMTFNSTSAMEAAGIHQFLRQKEFFSEYLSRNFSFPPDAAQCQPELVSISRVTEPITSLVAATTSVAHWVVGKKTMAFTFRFKFNPRADLAHSGCTFDSWWFSRCTVSKEYWLYLQAMQYDELEDEIQQQLRVHDLPCTSPTRMAACHTSDSGAACECESRARDILDGVDSCTAENCSRNCSPLFEVWCGESFRPYVDGGALSSSYNESLSALLVNGTKAAYDPSELQVSEDYPIEFDCHQSVEVVIGVEHVFEMLCPCFEFDGWMYVSRVMSPHGLLWKQSGLEDGTVRFVRLVALESALGNSSEAWVNVTVNYSSKSMGDNYYGVRVHPLSKPIDTPVNLSIHITRPEPPTEMWVPEAISVPCLVEQKAFELVVKFTGAGRMSELRGDYLETPRWNSRSGIYLGDDHKLSRLSRFFSGGPVADVLWSRPGRQSYEMPQEELEAWRLRRNQSGRPGYRRIIRSIQASNSSSLTLTLFPPAGGRDTTWSFCFFPADGSHIYEEICTASFPVRQSEAECNDLSIGQRLRIVWLFLFLLCMK